MADVTAGAARYASVAEVRADVERAGGGDAWLLLMHMVVVRLLMPVLSMDAWRMGCRLLIGRAPLYPVGVRGARYHGQGSWAGECGSPGPLGKGELGSWSERAHNLIAQETAISIQCCAATQ